MAKEKPDFKERVISFFTFHYWLKLISLILAVLVWFYVKGRISRYY